MCEPTTRRLLLAALAAGLAQNGLFGASAPLDLSKAVALAPPNASGAEKKAIAVLREEIEKRTQVLLPVAESWPADNTPVIAIGSVSRLATRGGQVRCAAGGRAWDRRGPI